MDIVTTSSTAGAGLDVLSEVVTGTTVPLGPSGAGEFTHANALLGRERMDTSEVRAGDGKAARGNARESSKRSRTEKTVLSTRTDWITRAETDADIPAIREINLAAFDTAEEANLVDALRTDPAWMDGLSILSAGPDGKPVGYALLTRCHVDDTPALCLGPCAVLPAHQRTGAGSAAIRAALAAAEQAGEHFVIVLGHPTYYPRFGFTRASEYGIRLSIDVPDEALMALSLDSEQLPSGTVRYAPPFGI